MSNSTALALIIGSAFLGVFAYLNIYKWAHTIAAEIVTGLVRSIPVPNKWRWLMLYNQWVPMNAAGLVVAIFVAVANMKIASLSEDPGVNAVAHLVAWSGALLGAGCFLIGASDFVFLRGIVRQAEAD